MFALALAFVFPAPTPAPAAPPAEVRRAAGNIGNRFRVTPGQEVGERHDVLCFNPSSLFDKLLTLIELVWVCTHTHIYLCVCLFVANSFDSLTKRRSLNCIRVWQHQRRVIFATFEDAAACSSRNQLNIQTTLSI